MWVRVSVSECVCVFIHVHVYTMLCYACMGACGCKRGGGKEWERVSLAGAATSIIFVTTKVSSQQKFCHNKHVSWQNTSFVATKVCYICMGTCACKRGGGKSEKEYHWRELPQASFLSQQKFCHNKHVSWQNTSFVATKVCLLQQQKMSWQNYVCCNKAFVTTNIWCDKLVFVTTNFVMTNMCLLQQKHACHDKRFAVTKSCWLQQIFVMTKLLWRLFVLRKKLWQNFCYNKHTFVMKNSCLSQQTRVCRKQSFCCNKNSTCGSSHRCQWHNRGRELALPHIHLQFDLNTLTVQGCTQINGFLWWSINYWSEWVSAILTERKMINTALFFWHAHLCMSLLWQTITPSLLFWHGHACAGDCWDRRLLPPYPFGTNTHIHESVVADDYSLLTLLT